MSKNITVAAGNCAVESELKTMQTAYKISLIGNIAQPYGITFVLRGGAWKPRTRFYVTNGNGEKEREFDGTGLRGLIWLAKAGNKYSLPIVSELMSEKDLIYFNGSYTDEDLRKADFAMEDDLSDLMGPEKHFDGLNPETDFIQIGAKNCHNYALLYRVGKDTRVGVLHKNPLQGIDPNIEKEAIQRYRENREIVYCTRGQSKYLYPDGKPSPEHQDYLKNLLEKPDQHPNARFLNNIKVIEVLREMPEFEHIKFCHDPSHTWGGKTHLMRRKIGDYAIKAITEFGYDMIMIEVDDKSRDAKCDGDQALLTTLNGIDWSQTATIEEPPKDELPLTLVDIVKSLMDYQINIRHVNISQAEKEEDFKRLNNEIRWDMTP